MPGGCRTRVQLVVSLVVLLVGRAGQAAAQPPAPPAEPPVLEASAQFSFLDTRGNATSQSLGAGGDFVWRPAPWTHSAKVVFTQTESDDDLSARSLAALFRAARARDARVSYYGQYDFLRDLFAGVEQRHVAEGGISLLAIGPEPHSLRLDAALGYLYENRPDDHFDSATASLGAAYRWTISPTSQFRYEPRFLLALTEGDSWKFDQEAVLAVAMNSFLALKLSHTIRYSAQPPVGFERTDAIMAVALTAKVRRMK